MILLKSKGLLIGAFVVAISCLLVIITQRSAVSMEINTDRQGSDYKNFDLSSADPKICRNACAKDSQCKAWTYVNPGYQKQGIARCWLKNDVPSPTENTCCVSGVIRVGAQSTKELDMNRPGKDYESFDITDPDFASVSSQKRPDIYCKEPCLKDPECKAWTYVRPGIQGPTARCWLKSGVPAPVADECCVSGVLKRF